MLSWRLKIDKIYMDNYEDIIREKHKQQEQYIDSAFECGSFVDWYNVSKIPDLSEQFIEKHFNRLNLLNICYFSKLSEEFIQKHISILKCVSHSICFHQKLSEKFIRNNLGFIDWEAISQTQELSIEFLREFKDKIFWHNVISYKQLDEDVLLEFLDKIDLELVFVTQNVSEDFISKYIDDNNDYHWRAISLNKKIKLSKNFIENFKFKKYLENIPMCCFSHIKHSSWRAFL